MNTPTYPLREKIRESAHGIDSATRELSRLRAALLSTLGLSAGGLTLGVIDGVDWAAWLGLAAAVIAVMSVAAFASRRQAGDRAYRGVAHVLTAAHRGRSAEETDENLRAAGVADVEAAVHRYGAARRLPILPTRIAPTGYLVAALALGALSVLALAR
jgi:hypothetical protein